MYDNAHCKETKEREKINKFNLSYTGRWLAYHWPIRVRLNTDRC